LPLEEWEVDERRGNEKGGIKLSTFANRYRRGIIRVDVEEYRPVDNLNPYQQDA